MHIMPQKLSAPLRDVDFFPLGQAKALLADLEQRIRATVRDLRDGRWRPDGMRATRVDIDNAVKNLNNDYDCPVCFDWTTQAVPIIESTLAEKQDIEAVYLQAVTASDLKSKRIEWFLPNRIPLPSFCLLEGEGGGGKSLIALDLIARGSNGSQLPDGSPGFGVIKSLFFAAEDATHILKARLQAAKANLVNVTFVPWVNVEEGRASFTLPDHSTALEDLIVRTGAKLVYIDSLFDTFAAGLDTNRARDVRSALGPLRDVAHNTGCVILATRHVSKTPGRASTRGLGSADFVNLARAVLQVAPHPTEPERRLLSIAKKNYGRQCDALAFRIEGVDIKLDDGNVENVPYVKWLGTDATTADEAALGMSSKRDVAKTRLLEALAVGEVKSEDLARQIGCSVDTLFRARRDLNVAGHNIRAHKTGLNGGWIWSQERSGQTSGFASDESSQE